MGALHLFGVQSTLLTCIFTFTVHHPGQHYLGGCSPVTHMLKEAPGVTPDSQGLVTPYTTGLCLQSGHYRRSSLWPVSGAFPCLLQADWKIGYPFTLSCQRLDPPFPVFYPALYCILHASPSLTTLVTPLTLASLFTEPSFIHSSC